VDSYLNERHGCHGIGGTEYCTQKHDFFEIESLSKDEPIDEICEGTDEDKT
jgi:hypothetical protein